MQTTWLTSTIAFELQNEAYEDDHLMRRLSAVKENVQADEIQAVGEALASLQVPTIEEVLKVETSVLIPGV